MPLEATLGSSSALQTPGQTPGGGTGGEESPAGPGGVTPPAWGQGGPIMVFGRGRSFSAPRLNKHTLTSAPSA